MYTLVNRVQLEVNLESDQQCGGYTLHSIDDATRMIDGFITRNTGYVRITIEFRGTGLGQDRCCHENAVRDTLVRYYHSQCVVEIHKAANGGSQLRISRWC